MWKRKRVKLFKIKWDHKYEFVVSTEIFTKRTNEILSINVPWQTGLYWM